MGLSARDRLQQKIKEEKSKADKAIRGYKQGLIDRFGEEGQAIIDYCETNSDPVKWTWEELEKNRAEYNARIREIESILCV